jgi:TetR/AcrR family transcriptional regulator, transcriptional repressor for nem operon
MARTKDFDESEVLNRAMQLFWQKGYNGTSMQDLVDGLGISRSSMYDTFGDKHTLYIRSLKHYKATTGNKLCGILDPSGPPKEAIRQLLESTSRELRNDNESKGCFMVNAEVEVAAHDSVLKDLLKENDQQLEQSVYELICLGQESGEISNTKSARALTRFILNTVKGIQVSAKSVKDKAVFDDVIETAMMVL